MVQEFMDIRVPGIPGAIYSQMEAEAMADKKIAELNAPMTGAGMSRHHGVPRTEVGMMAEGDLNLSDLRQMILQEMRMAPTHAGAIEMMQANPDETVMFEPEDPTDAPMPGMGMPAQGTYPHLDRMALEQELASHGLQNLPPEMPDKKLASLLQALGGPVMLQEKRTRRDLLREMEEAPSAAVVAGAVEQVQDPGLLTRIYNMIKQTIDPPPMTPEERARAQEEFSAMVRSRKGAMANPQTMGDKLNRFLSGAPEAAFDDIGTLTEGYEPGGYRYEGDRRLNEVSIGTGRWNLLAGTDEK
jgi:hypothetical protein